MTPADQARLLSELRPGLSVFVQGATGEPQGLIAALQSDPERARGVAFTAPLIPGINSFDYAGLHPEAELTTFMAAESLRASIDAGRARIIPLCYSQIAKTVAAAAYDVAVLQLTPPDANGRCSFGVSSDFGPLAWRRAGRRIGIINPAMARPPRSETVAFSALDLTVEDDSPLIATDEPAPSPVLTAIAAHVASLIPDGAALQTGVGGAPAATLAQLTDRRDLVIRSGMITEGYRTLAKAGALARSNQHITGIAYGSADFYAWLRDTDLTAFASVKHTHGAAELGETPSFMAINSALEVDLFGQANLEWRGGRAISGVGGAPDFARGAAASQGGRSIIAMPSTAKAVSRITARLTSATVSLARTDVDTVVTEHGIAELRGKTLDERAEALIAIADAAHRGALTDAWRDLRR
jgi:acyl-CoA hydrolase